MKIYIGADHRGVKFKDKVLQILHDHNYDIVDVGGFDENVVCDYPKIAYKVASAVAKSRNTKGILICMSGIGQAIAANKVKGAYAALCYNPEAAELSRRHNNANVLVLSAKFTKESDIEHIIVRWLDAEFEGDRHLRRFNQIRAIEAGKELK